jgi:hypothetical protein
MKSVAPLGGDRKMQTMAATFATFGSGHTVGVKDECYCHNQPGALNLRSHQSEKSQRILNHFLQDAFCPSRGIHQFIWLRESNIHTFRRHAAFNVCNNKGGRIGAFAKFLDGGSNRASAIVVGAQFMYISWFPILLNQVQAEVYFPG